jgi:hypothetical protein
MSLTPVERNRLHSHPLCVYRKVFSPDSYRDQEDLVPLFF